MDLISIPGSAILHHDPFIGPRTAEGLANVDDLNAIPEYYPRQTIIMSKDSDKERPQLAVNTSLHASSTTLPTEKSPGSLESSQTIIVDFDDTFLHPHAWPNSRRWSILILTVIITTLANISTTIVVPSLDVISAELNTDPISEGPLVMSSYVLTLAFGPLLVAPFSELWGRVPLMQAGNIVYMGFNLACGFATSRAQLLAFRVLAGLGSGATPVVSTHRGSSMAYAGVDSIIGWNWYDK